VLVDVGHAGSGQHVNAELRQLRQRFRGQVFGEGRQNAMTCLEQVDLRRRWINRSKVLGEHVARELGESSRELDARGAAADDGEIQELATTKGVSFTFGELEREKNALSNLERVIHAFQTRSKRLPLLVAEVTRLGPGGENEEIVAQFSGIERHTPSRQIDRDHLGEEHGGVLLTSEHRPRGRRDVGHGQRSHRYLIEERLK